MEEGEEEEEEAQDQRDAGQNMTGGTLGGINEAIPEEEGTQASCHIICSHFAFSLALVLL